MLDLPPTLIELSEGFTNDAHKQALLQGPKAGVFLRSTLKLFAYLGELERVPTNLPVTSSASECLIESLPEPPTYKHQEHYLWFDHDFDIEDDKEAELLWLRLRQESSLRESPLYTQASPLPSITPTTTPTTAAADLLLTLIYQVPATSLPSPLSPFNFSYIHVTPPQTTPGLSADSDTVTSSSSALAIKTVPCNDYGTVNLPTTSLERITSYSLLSLNLLILSQFIKLSHGADHYCTVLTSTQRPDKLSSSTPSTITKTSTPPLQDLPSRSVSSDDVSNHPYSFSSAVDVGLTMILTMMILPTILIIILIILPMMLLMLPAVIGTHKERYIFSDDDMTTNTVRPVQPTSVPNTMSTAPPLLPPHTNQVKGKSFVYSDSSFGLSFKS